MCGRFSQRMSLHEIDDLYQLIEAPSTDLPEPRWNGRPTQNFAVCRLRADGPREATPLRWGLVPSWSRDRRMTGQMINARAETITLKPAFRSAFRSRRCLVPANGWFEWRRLGSGGKRPWFIESADSFPLSFAAIWERWSQGEESVETFSILTEAACPELRHLHHRQPVVVAPERFEEWLATDRQPWRGDSEDWLSVAAVRSGFTWRPMPRPLDGQRELFPAGIADVESRPL